MHIPSHLLTPWLSSRITVDGGLVRIDAPRTVGGALPAGRRHLAWRTDDVADLWVTWTLRSTRALLAVALAAVTVVVPVPPAIAALTVVLGTWIALTSVGWTVHVKPWTGQRVDVPVRDRDLGQALVDLVAADRMRLEARFTPASATR